MRTYLILVILASIISVNATCNRKTQINVEGFKPLQIKMNLQGFSDDCRKFIRKELRPHWILHVSEECYFDNQKLWESVLGQKECFIGKNRQQIQSILGKPIKTLISKDTWEYYYMGKICEKYYPYFSLQFHYDENEVLKNIGQSQVTYN